MITDDGAATAADFAREMIAAAGDPGALIARLRSALAHDWTGDTLSPAERDAYEEALATELILRAMAQGIRVDDEVRVVRGFEQVHPHVTDIDARYIVDAIAGDSATIRLASHGSWRRTAPLTCLVRTGVCDGHRDGA